MWPKVNNGVVRARYARILDDHAPRLAQRKLGLKLLRSQVVQQDIVGEPLVKELLALLLGSKRIGSVPYHLLQVMCKARCGKDVLQLDGETSVCVRLISEIKLRLLGRLSSH